MQCNVNCGCSYLIGVFKGTKKKVVPPPPPPAPVVPVAPTPARQPDRIEWVTKRYNVPCAEVTYEVKKVNGVETGEMRNTKNITSDTYTARENKKPRYYGDKWDRVKVTTFRRWYVNGTQVCVEKVSETTEFENYRPYHSEHNANDPDKSNNS
jgi:hypothetical protein